MRDDMVHGCHGGVRPRREPQSCPFGNDSLAAASPPDTSRALVIPRRLISDNGGYPHMEDNQRGKRVIKEHSGEGSHPGRSIHFYINCARWLIINSAEGWIYIKVSMVRLSRIQNKSWR